MGAQEEINYNYYTILECSIDATLDEIKRAYHKLALQHHPDKNNVHQNPQMFQCIEEAWRILSDDESRKEYDTQLRQSNLENMSILLYSRIRPDELQTCQDDTDLLKYTCRCGGDYKIHKMDLKENHCTIHVSCQDCTLVIAIDT